MIEGFYEHCRRIGKYEVADCVADIFPGEPNNERVDGVYIHWIPDEFGDGDCILFNYHVISFENDYDIEVALNNEAGNLVSDSNIFDTIIWF